MRLKYEPFLEPLHISVLELRTEPLGTALNLRFSEWTVVAHTQGQERSVRFAMRGNLIGQVLNLTP